MFLREIESTRILCTGNILVCQINATWDMNILVCAQCSLTCAQSVSGLCSSTRSCNTTWWVERTETTCGALPTWHTMAILSGEFRNIWTVFFFCITVRVGSWNVVQQQSLQKCSFYDGYFLYNTSNMKWKWITVQFVTIQVGATELVLCYI